MSARLLMIGAGLGGLTAGIALCRAGFEVQLYEQTQHLGEAGAGISLSQAAFSVYRSLDLSDAIESNAMITAGMAFLHYRSGALLAGRMDLGHGSGDPDAPLAARQMHRADLQAILTEAFQQAGGTLYLGHRLIGLADEGDRITARFANGATAEGELLIGADGLKSVVRALLWGSQPARFTDQIAYRFLVPIEAARRFLQFGRSALFQGPGRVFNRYSIRGGALVNCVGIVRTGQWQDDGWSIAADRDEVLAEFRDWHPDVTGLIAQGERLIKWGLFDRPALTCWSRGRATLLGDAAHPMLPFLGLGAAMAIEDSLILARALQSETSIAAALGRYESARRPRTALVQEMSVLQGALVQSADPDRFDPGSAPSHDPSFYAYDPVTAPI